MKFARQKVAKKMHRKAEKHIFAIDLQSGKSMLHTNHPSIKLVMYLRCLCTRASCKSCVVLSYVRPHNNLSTCATAYLATCYCLLLLIQTASTLHFFTLVLLIPLCKSKGEIKGFVLVVVNVPPPPPPRSNGPFLT